MFLYLDVSQILPELQHTDSEIEREEPPLSSGPSGSPGKSVTRIFGNYLH